MAAACTAHCALVCQRCNNPLRLGPEFDDLQRAELLSTLNELGTAAADQSAPLSLLPADNAHTDYPRYTIQPRTGLASSGETLMGGLIEYESNASSNLDHRFKVNAYLFDMLSGRTEVDHPVCQECADALIAAQSQSLAYHEEELVCLQSYLDHLNAQADRLARRRAVARRKRSKVKAQCAARQAGDALALGGGDGKGTLLADGKRISVREVDLSDNDNEDDEEEGSDSERRESDEGDLSSDLDDYDDDDDDEEEEELNADECRSCDGKQTSSSRAESRHSLSPRASSRSGGIRLDSSERSLRGRTGGGGRGRGARTGRRKNLATMEAEVARLRDQLASVTSESDQLDVQLARDSIDLEARVAQLDKATQDYNDQILSMLHAEDELMVLESRIVNAQQQYSRLKHTNVLNIAFPIWVDGHIGIINGLHLGRLHNCPIKWAEINAAWGQCTLLLQCIIRRLNYTLQNFQLVPIGIQSKIIQLSSGKELPLYYEGMGIFTSSKFDAGMTAYLDCVHQVQVIMERTDGVQLPYRITPEKGRIFDEDDQSFSIKWNKNTEENWTKALKFMLINLKWIIGGIIVVCNSGNHVAQPARTLGNANNQVATSVRPGVGSGDVRLGARAAGGGSAAGAAAANTTSVSSSNRVANKQAANVVTIRGSGAGAGDVTR